MLHMLPVLDPDTFGSIILEDLYTSSERIIILPIGGYLHVLTFLSALLMDLTAHHLLAMAYLIMPICVVSTSPLVLIHPCLPIY